MPGLCAGHPRKRQELRPHLPGANSIPARFAYQQRRMFQRFVRTFGTGSQQIIVDVGVTSNETDALDNFLVFRLRQTLHPIVMSIKSYQDHDPRHRQTDDSSGKRPKLSAPNPRGLCYRGKWTCLTLNGQAGNEMQAAFEYQRRRPGIEPQPGLPLLDTKLELGKRRAPSLL